MISTYASLGAISTYSFASIFDCKSAATLTFNSWKPENPNDLHKRITAALLVALFSPSVFAVNNTASSGYVTIYVATFFSDVGKLSITSLNTVKPPFTFVIYSPSCLFNDVLFHHICLL